jgi:hypothetical protein
MKKPFVGSALVLGILAFLVLGCFPPGGGGGSGPAPLIIDDLSISYGGSGHSVTGYTHNGESETDLSISLTDLANSDVYLVYTNTGSSGEIIREGVGSGVLANETSPIEPAAAEGAAAHRIHSPREIAEFNAHPPPLLTQFGAKGSILEPPPAPVFYTVGSSTLSWNVYNPSDPDNPLPLATTLRAMEGNIAGTSNTLLVWVSDAMWGGTIDATNLADLVDAYVNDNPSIYYMTRQIVGDEWGSHGYSNLISASTDEIHIVLYDIFADGPWGVVGYFWSLHNYLKGSDLLSYSNEALVVFIDAPTFASGSTGYMFTFRTLAHEFQHLVHFYQKNVKRGTDSETWLNEMSSMMIEDMLATNMAAVGGDNGPARKTGDRLYDHATDPGTSLTSWIGSQADYGTAFSFGGYMARLFSDAGRLFLQKLVQSSFEGIDAVNYALSTAGAGISADEALRLWGATLALDPAKGPLPTGYGYPQRIGSGVFGASDMELVAASMYEYKNPHVFITPKMYLLPPSAVLAKSHVVWFYQENISGDLTFDIRLPSYTSLSVVVSPH